MIRVGLTGGIAAGKSNVANELAALGAVVIDADELARQAVQPGTPGLAAIVARFGTEMLLPNGSLDRAALADLVFADQDALADLNRIVHPLVRSAAERCELAAPADSVIVHDIPLLLETGQQHNFDLVVVVDVPVAVQLERVQRRDQASAADAMSRIQAQASRADRLAVADAVIDSSGSKAATRCQVGELWRWLHAPDGLAVLRQAKPWRARHC